MEDWDIQSTVQFIKLRKFKRVTLQFPDHLLHASPSVAAALRSGLSDHHGCQVFVLADSTYHSLGVDEVAAAHVHADCVVHYGYASLVPVSRIPAYFVFPKQPMNLQQAASDLLQYAGSCSTQVLVFPDQAHLKQLEALQAAIHTHHAEGASRLVFAKVAARHLNPPCSKGHSDASHSQSLPPPAAASCAATSGGLASAPEALTPDGSSVRAATNSTNGVPALITASGAAAAPWEALSALQLGGCSSCGCASQVQHATQPGCSTTTSSNSFSSLHRSGDAQLLEADSTGPSSQQPAPSTVTHLTGCGGRGHGRPCAPSSQDATTTTSTSTDSHHCPACGGGVAATASGKGAARSSPDAAAVSETSRDQLLCWHLPSGALQQQSTCVWLGPTSSPLLLTLQLTLNQLPWRRYDPQTGCWEEGVLPQATSLLKKRYYLVEKARSASIVGLLVGTLGNATCLLALERLRSLAQQAGKKTYTFLMGKPAPQKLANFPEVEVFVMLADPQGFILDSKEYYAPIITPFEAWLAFSGRPWTGEYSLELDNVLARGPDTDVVDEEGSTALALSGAGALLAQGNSEIVKSAAQFLSKRTWHGLETPLTGADPKDAELAQVGYTGRASSYRHEPHKP